MRVLPVQTGQGGCMQAPVLGDAASGGGQPALGQGRGVWFDLRCLLEGRNFSRWVRHRSVVLPATMGTAAAATLGFLEPS